LASGDIRDIVYVSNNLMINPSTFRIITATSNQELACHLSAFVACQSFCFKLAT